MISSGLRPTANKMASWRGRVFQNFRLYAVTDLKKVDADFFDRVSAIYAGGVDIIQLRAKCLPMAEMVRIGLRMKKIATMRRKLFFVNDSVDLAVLSGADGVHVGQEDISPLDVRRLCNKYNRNLLVGLSTHSVSQARAAQNEPVDYFAVGPVFQTPTKPHYQAVGLKLVRSVSRFARKPWVAIGGINVENVNDVMFAGAKRVAVVRALFSARHAEAAARLLSVRLKGDSL